VARLGQDYTVYAFDYSEYETPLVGQGMLSRCLAAASSTPSSTAFESETMVTGRVCKNLLGVFAGGVKETLEVKLRLVPVPICLQTEYLASMEGSRDVSMAMPNGFDAAGWSNLLNTNPFFPVQGSSIPPSPAIDQATVFNGWNGSQMGGPGPQQMSRPSTPIPGLAPVNQLRPQSRASVNRRASLAQSISSTQANDMHNDTSIEFEDGPAPKRARTMKANWRGPSAFATTSDSLRVTASTAASIRIQRPSLGGIATSNLDGDIGGRPPTPRPHSSMARKSLLTRTTSLAQEMSVHSSDGYVSQFGDGGTDGYNTSPEKSDRGSTPQDVPSSPPIPRLPSPRQSSPAFADSGFVSGPMDECMTENEEEGQSPPEGDTAAVESIEVPKKRGALPLLDSGLMVEQIMPGDPQLLPMRMLPRPVRPPVIARPPPRPRASKAGSMSSPALTSASLPSEAAPPPISMPPPSFDRASSSVPYPPSEPDRTSPEVEPLPSNEEESNSSRGKQANGPSLKRKTAIQDRLARDIQAGKMPPYCRNCGDINTPTWRKTFMQIVNGNPDERTEQELKLIVGTEALQFDDNEKVIQYRQYKKFISTQEASDGWQEVQLCNPCGIWLTKWTFMRPQDRWYKGVQPTRKSKKRNVRELSEIPGSDAAAESSAVQPAQSEAPLPQPRPRRARTGSKLQRTQSTASEAFGEREQSAPPMNNAEAQAALQRAIQSSPPRVAGTWHSPIEVDEEQATCRLIFPSPRRAGHQKLLDAPSIVVDPVKVASSIVAPIVDLSMIDPELIAASNDKENVAPVLSATDEENLSNFFDGLIEGSLSPFRLPRTPKSARSGQASRTPTSSTRKRLALTPGDFMNISRMVGHSGTPSPSRLAGTGMTLSAEAEMTPFTRHLTQLLADANDGGNGQDQFQGDLGGLGVNFEFDASSMDGMVMDGQDTGNMFTFSDFSNEGTAVRPSSTIGSVTESFDFEMYEDPVETKAEADVETTAAVSGNGKGDGPGDVDTTMLERVDDTLVPTERVSEEVNGTVDETCEKGTSVGLTCA